MRNVMTGWIKKHKNAGMKMLDKIQSLEFCKEIFKAWDVNKKGYLSVEELTEKLMALGLATDREFVGKLL